MFPYLYEREKEEMLRTDKRTLLFPDGERREIETFRLVWRWFDRVIAYEFGPDETELLTLALEYSELGKMDVAEALGWALEGFVHVMETDGGADITDDNIDLLIAKRAVGRFDASKRNAS